MNRTLILALVLSAASPLSAFAHRGDGPFDKTTRRLGAVILRTGLAMDVTWMQAVGAVAAAMTETNGPNQAFPAKITNPHYGDSSSVGIFQMLDIHGSVKQRMNPWWASRWWFRQARQQADARQADNPAELAQAVEDSAYPSRYRAQVKDATILARSLGYYKDAKGRLKRKAS